MKVQTKISLEAQRIAKDYIRLISENKTPAMLAAWVEKSKYDIMAVINDRRLNMSDTLEKIRIEARFEINQQLNKFPYLKDRLIQFRSLQNK